MQLVQNLLQGSLLWRFLAAVCGWFGNQWQKSRVVQSFLHPSPLGESIARSSVFFRLWSRLRALLALLYQRLKLDRVFTGSIFLQSFLWCALAAVLTPLLSTMQAAALVAVAFASLALNLLRSGADDPEMAEIAEECKQECYDLFVQAAQQVKDWADYLFRDGSMIGLNKDILCQYVEYITNIRMQAVGLDLPFQTRSNPIPWINTWLVSDNVQVAPQEVEVSSYLVGQIDAEVDTDDLSNFQL